MKLASLIYAKGGSMRVCVISGVSSGIGNAILQRYIKEGYRVVCIDKDCLPDMQEHPQVDFIQGDIGEKKVIESFCDHIKKSYDAIHLIVHNACLSKQGILSGCSYEDFNYVLQVGVSAPYYMTSLLKELFAKGASVVNITSTRAFMSQQDSESYSAAKGGIYALTHALSVSLRGVCRVNAIAPGWIQTTEYEISEEDRVQHSVGRVGEVADIVHMVEYLSSEKASFINGQTFVVDGGMSTQMIYHKDHGWEYKG